MKKQNFQYNYQYYNHLSKSRYSGRTSRRLRSENGDTISSRSKTRFYHRIEKACTTFSDKDINKEVYLCRREIERLQKQILKKDKTIFQIKEINMHNKEIQTELIEVYRVLYLYQGKISEYQKELKKLEIHIASKTSSDITDKVEQLLESYRIENGELASQLEEKNRIIMELETKLRKTENKYFNTAWKLSSTKRQISNPLKKRFPNLRNTITMNQTPLLEKQKALNLRNQGKSSTNFAPAYYQIENQTKQKQRDPITFKKIEGYTRSNQYQDLVSPMISTGGINNIRSSINNSNLQGTTLLKTANFNNNQVMYSQPRYEVSPVSQDMNYQNFQKIVIPQSNANLNSQLTVTNGINGKREDSTRIFRSEGPNYQKVQLSSPINNRYSISQNLNEVQNMMKSGIQSKTIGTPIKSGLLGQSIYLK